MIKENSLLPEVKEEIINAVLKFGDIDTMENQIESLHTWLIDHVELNDDVMLKGNLQVYRNIRFLLK